ncbi:pyridoxamine 5'-phosphate oxidase family protein [Parasphingorhabdus sp.]|uniref:pyridoxamine 5'-phosphate oxidase family protein n=1 Tax=Parasphingorhabdus sp. TaxID=2709688 RepID=UPI003001C350
MNSDDREELYELIEDIGTAMLVTETDDELRSRPMTGKLYRDSGEIWFLTESHSEKVEEIAEDRTSNLTYACPEKEAYISITGTSLVNRDADKIDDLWGPWAKAWLQCEKDDPKVAAIRFKPEMAEFWSSPTSSLVQAWQLAKANVTNEKPDMGTNKSVNMS